MIRGYSWLRHSLLLLLLLAFVLPPRGEKKDAPAGGCHAWSGDRRIFLRKSLTSSALLFGGTTYTSTTPPALSQAAAAGAFVEDGASSAIVLPEAPPIVQHPFRYSDEWTGTALPLLSLEQALTSATVTASSPSKLSSPQDQSSFFCWPMGRWPDPILRRAADPVDTTSRQWLGRTAELQRACDILRQTAIANGAVGLAAQQCGVNARIVYVELDGGNIKNKKRSNNNNNNYITMINPRIVNRSPETAMRVWREECLVLPPSFRATVLRDDWVDVVYDDISGSSDGTTSSITLPEKMVRLRGETARALQHELDHDRGLLVTDHVSLEELESDVMRAIERPGHEERMARAYTRYFMDSV